MASTKFVPFNRLRLWRRKRSQYRPVVAVNGCFDILHVGHVHLLRSAASFGCLIVGINSDESVKRLKGPTRPVNTAVDRAEVLSALQCVTAVTIFEQDNAAQFLAAVVPDFWVKGADYTRETVNQKELAVIENVYGRLRFVDLLPGHSTTHTINTLQKSV